MGKSSPTCGNPPCHESDDSPSTSPRASTSRSTAAPSPSRAPRASSPPVAEPHRGQGRRRPGPRHPSRRRARVAFAPRPHPHPDRQPHHRRHPGLHQGPRGRRHRLPRAGEGLGHRVRARLLAPHHRRAARGHQLHGRGQQQASPSPASTSRPSARWPPTSASSASPSPTRARVSATPARSSAARPERQVSDHGREQGKSAAAPSSHPPAQEGRGHRGASASRRHPFGPSRLRAGRRRRARATPSPPHRPSRPTCARSTATRPPRPAASASSSPSVRRPRHRGRRLRPRWQQVRRSRRRHRRWRTRGRAEPVSDTRAPRTSDEHQDAGRAGGAAVARPACRRAAAADEPHASRRGGQRVGGRDDRNDGRPRPRRPSEASSSSAS